MEISHIGNNQKVLVICVKFSNVATTRLATARDWVNLLNSQVNQFYAKATYGQTSFLFETVSGGPSDGWFQLAYPNNRSEGFYISHLQDAIDLVDAFVDFREYNRFLVIATGTSFFGQSNQGFESSWRTSTGIENWFEEDGQWVGKRLMTGSVISEWEAGNTQFDSAASNVAHELGHSLDVKEHYGSVTIAGQGVRNIITPWSVMGLWQAPPTHFTGWSKNERGWLGNNHVKKIGPPVGQSIDTLVDLWPQEIAIGSAGHPTNDPQLILIPFTNSAPFHGYVIENRQKINGDESIPKEGILISLVEEGSESLIAYLVVENSNFPGDLNQAPLVVGDIFHDAQRNISISVESTFVSRGYWVRVKYPLPPNAKPDPMITPWGAPPWETIDLWIDSEKNGWDTYKYIDVTGDPEGNGDDPWLNRDNRIYVRVRNVGPGDATNVRVKVYVNQPPGIGDAGNDWTQVGTNLIFPHIPAGNSAVGYVLWKPTDTEHTCIKAEIQTTPDEVEPGNNLAQENIAAFETSSNSPWKPVNLKVQVYNPSSIDETPVRFHVRDLPQDWGVKLDPPTMVLKPGEKSAVVFTVYPAGPPGRQPSDLYRIGYLGKPKLEAWIPFEDTFILLGGVELWIRLVEETEINLDTPSVKTDGLITIGGYIKPAVVSAKVAIEFRSRKERHVSFAKVDEKGRYTTKFNPPRPGSWVVQAFFDGSNTFAKTESKIRKFEIT